MPPELVTISERIASLRNRSASAAGGQALVAEIEDALAHGYAEALAGDAWSMRTEQRLQELISDTDVPVRGRELRVLASEHSGFQRDLIALRRELAELCHDRDRLRAGSHATSA